MEDKEIIINNHKIIRRDDGIGIIPVENYKEKTADELFKELGYEKEHEGRFGINYKKENDNITFIKKSNLVDCVRWALVENEGIYIQNSFPINMQELQAINKKCKELEWI